MNYPNFSQITGRLWVGPRLNPDLVQNLRQLGITSVLNTAIELDDGPFLSNWAVQAAKFAISDDKKQHGWEWFGPAIPWALQSILPPFKKLYVHCHAGLHRSTSMVYAIMRAQGFTGSDAARIIMRQHSGAHLDYQNDAERELRRHGYIFN